MMLGLEAKATSSAGLASKRVAPSLVPVPAHRLTKAAFQPHVSKRNVRVAAAEKDAPKATAATPRAPRAVPTVNLADVKAGDEFEGTVASVAAFGAFVNFGAAKDGLLHVSQLGSFVKNVADVVKVGDKVNVKVLNLDAATGKIALTTKGTKQAEGSLIGAATSDSEAASSSGRRDPRAAQQEDDGVFEFADGPAESLPFRTVDDDSDVEEGPELEEGQVLVTADVPGYEELNFVMEDEDEELTDAALAELDAEEDVEVTNESGLVPYLTRVEGKVKRVEEYGIFVEFEYNGKTLTGLLGKDEMKVPFEKLDEEQQEDVKFQALAEAGQVEGEGEDMEVVEDEQNEVLPPEYVDIGDEFDITSYYNVGDSISTLVIDGGLEDGKIALSHFTDADIETNAIQLELEADEYDEEEVDPLAEDVEALLVDQADAEAAEAEAARLARGPRRRRDDDDEPAEVVPVVPVDADAVELDFVASTAGQSLATGGLLFSDPTKRDAVPNPIAPMAFPSRPLSKMDLNLAQLNLTEIDFDGDEVELTDVWDGSEVEEGIPKDGLRRLGYKLVVAADGAVDIVQREKAEPKEGEDAAAFENSWSILETASLNKRVASWVADLTDPEEEEAELPARALRRPLVFAASVSAPISATLVKSLRDKTGAGMMDCKKALAENDGDVDKSIEWLRKKGIMGADKKAGRLAAEGAVTQYIHPGSRLGVLLEVNSETDFVAASEKFQSLIGEIGMIICASPEVIVVSPEDVPEDVLAKEREVQMNLDDLKTKPEKVRAKIVEGRLEKIKNNLALLNQPSLRDNSKTVADIVKETIASVGENIQIRRFVKYQLGEGLEKRSNDFAAEVAQQTQAKAADKPKPPPPAPAAEAKTEAAKPAVQVSAAVVKQLRDKTGAGMMDCKKALGETGGDQDKAIEWLRIKGLAGADKKAGRLAAEGVVASYIHPGSRLGVLLEVNCETDFVAGSEKFQNLVNGIAMQIAASREVAYVSAEDIPAEVFEREKQIEMGREDLKSKPEAIRAKIAEGRAKKIAAEMALLDQPYLMDQSKTVAEAVKEAIASIGEKISVRRFVKYTLGEGLEKRSTDFAAEVAAVTGPKA